MFIQVPSRGTPVTDGQGNLTPEWMIYFEEVGNRLSKPVESFSFLKTADQTTVTTGTATIITFDSVEQTGEGATTSNDRFTAPYDGYIEVHASLSFIDGDGTDDSMSWGFYVDGSVKKRIQDNWRNRSTTNEESNSTFSTGFNLSQGEYVDLRYTNTNHAMTLMQDRCHFSGTFYPDLT